MLVGTLRTPLEHGVRDFPLGIAQLPLSEAKLPIKIGTFANLLINEFANWKFCIFAGGKKNGPVA